MPKKLGFYSEMVADLYGFAIYKDLEGKEVCCTEICDEGAIPFFKAYQDNICLGEVTDFISSHQKGKASNRIKLIDSNKKYTEEELIELLKEITDSMNEMKYPPKNSPQLN